MGTWTLRDVSTMFVAKPQALAQADGVQRQVKSICRSAHAILIERQVEGLHSALRLVPYT